MLAATGHAQFHDAGHFLTKAYAAGAMNAAAHFFCGYQRAEVLVKHHTLGFAVA